MDSYGACQGDGSADNDKVIQLTIGSDKMVINGITITMDVKAVVKNGRMLPVRWVGQALGCSVNYDAIAQTVTVQ